MARDFYKLLLVGASGGGKTYSFRNMDPKTTGFINVENKPLPFKNNFKYHKRIEKHSEVIETMIEYAKNPEIKAIVVDSFSKYIDLLLKHCRSTRKGFDIWSAYNEEIGVFHEILNKINKEVFVTAHYEIINSENNPEKTVKVKGNEWKGVIEKEYTIVLYAGKAFENNEVDHFFIGRGEGISAKIPRDIIEEINFPNDSNEVLNKLYKFLEVA